MLLYEKYIFMCINLTILLQTIKHTKGQAIRIKYKFLGSLLKLHLGPLQVVTFRVDGKNPNAVNKIVKKAINRAIDDKAIYKANNRLST